MSPAQCRAARALLGMSQSDLARAAVVPVASIVDFEAEILALRSPDLDAIQDALEKAGVSFTNGDAPGVQLRKRK